MHKFFRIGILVATAFTTVASAAAQSPKPAEWWLVIDDGNAQVAQFVDMASINRSDNGANISTMTVTRSGNRDMQTLTVDCERVLGAPGDASVKEFICGTTDYRNSNGLILGPVSPHEMAAIVFASQPVNAGGDSKGIT